MISFVILHGRRYTFDKLSLETPELRIFCLAEGDTSLISAITRNRSAVVKFELSVRQFEINYKTPLVSLEIAFQLLYRPKYVVKQALTSNVRKKLLKLINNS